MKAFVSAALLTCGSCISAVAADVPDRQVFFDPSAPNAAFAPSFPSAPRTPVFIEPPPPTFDWTGLYLGANAGYIFGKTNYGLNGTGPATIAGLQSGSVPTLFGTRASGFTGGGQIGFNKQLDRMLIPPLAKVGGDVVLGIEADAAYTGLSATGGAVLGSVATTLHDRTEFVGTARGRVGIAFDRLLVFGTGGFAYGGVDTATTVAVAGINAFTGAKSSLRSGYTYGGGLEYAFAATPLFKAFMSPAVTLRVEYLHYDLGASSLAATSTFGSGESYGLRTRDSGNVVRAAVNYKFDLKIPAPPY